MSHSLKDSWKTTAFGVATILLSVVQAVSAVVAGRAVDETGLAEALAIGIGLIFSKDHDQ